MFQFFKRPKKTSCNHISCGQIVGNGSIVKKGELILETPLHITGDGIVTLENRVQIGYLPAPKIGNGDVHLQARTKKSTIHIGRDTMINNNASIIATMEILIGEKCLIGNEVIIMDSDFHHISPEKRHMQDAPSKPVYIGNNVWIGSRVIILKGVHIGNDSVIGAGSVVTRDIPERSLVAGNPAKIIRAI